MTPALIAGKEYGRAVMCADCGQRWPRFYSRGGHLTEGFHRCPRCARSEIYLCVLWAMADPTP